MENNNKPTVFSGVQPSGVLHLGNYLGALAQWVEMQNQYNCIFCVVDYHAITVKQEPKELSARILEVARTYLAAGINPEKAVIFQQSAIRAHTELGWILNCISRLSDLDKMTQFKDKIGLMEEKNIISEIIRQGEIALKEEQKAKKELEKNKNFASIDNFDKLEKSLIYARNSIMHVLSARDEYINIIKRLSSNFESNIKKEKASVGLYDYPVLMAADILLYNTDSVPVGDDQVQHVELCRTLAQRFNREYGEVFKVPEVVIRKQGARIMGLDDSTKKMSKSASSSANYIALTDSPDVAAKKIMRAVTDSGSEVKYEPKKKPAISNLLVIYSLLSCITIKELEARYKNKGYGDFKKDLAEVVKNFLAEFQIKYNSFSDDDIKQILRDGADKIRPIAEETLTNVKNKLGIN